MTSKGQVTIPKPIRVQTGLLPGSEVEFAIEDDVVVLRRSAVQRSRGELFVEHLRSHLDEFAMTTEEIMALTRGEE